MADSEWVSDPTFKVADEGEWESDPSFKPEKTSSNPILEGVKFVGKALDYPFAPIRETVGSALDLAQGKEVKNPLRFLKDGPEGARSFADLYEQSGMFPKEGSPAVPLGMEQFMTDEEKQAAPKYNPAAMAGSLTDTALGHGVGVVADKGVSAVKQGANAIGNKLAAGAEQFAENATGATAKQAEKFKPNAGRELLDRGLVKFGDNAEDIAKRTGAAVDDANHSIDGALKALDARGVKVSADNVVAELQSQIKAMKADPSKAGAVRKLESIINDIIETGQSNIPLSLGEETKRGFRKAAGNWMDPEAGQAGKSAYLAYRDEVENAAKAAEPGLANAFKEGKETYGLLAPIKEAAERRAATLNQSPFGGLLDITTGGAGTMAGGPIVGAATAVGRRLLAPRISSSAAVTLDKVSKMMMQSPKMAQLAKTNPSAFQNLAIRLTSQTKGLSEAGEHSFPRAAENQQDNTTLLDRYSEDPSKLDFLQNDKLKEQLKKNSGQRTISGPVPVEHAQASFIQGN